MYGKYYRAFLKVSISEFVGIFFLKIVDQTKAKKTYTLSVTNITSPEHTEKESEVPQLSATVRVNILKKSCHRQV